MEYRRLTSACQALGCKADVVQSHRYVPGDVLEIRPENSDEDVANFLDSVGWREFADVEYDIMPTTEGEFDLCVSLLDQVSDLLPFHDRSTAATSFTQSVSHDDKKSTQIRTRYLQCTARFIL